MRPQTADAAWHELLAGNIRFTTGAALHPRQTSQVRAELLAGQHPLAVIVGCSDSRVPVEILFDCGLGDLFVVRSAGQVLTVAGCASVEYAVAHLGVKLIVVLGHSRCGALHAAVHGETAPGHLGELLALLQPTVAAMREKPGSLLDNAIEENVRRGVQRLRALDPVLSGLVTKGDVAIRGAIYELETGQVRGVSDV